MLRSGATTIRTMRYLIVVVWLAASLATDTAHCDNLPGSINTKFRKSFNDKVHLDIECAERYTGNSFCNFRTDMQYSKYLNTSIASHEIDLSVDSEDDQRRADLLMIFKLAVEEFNFLSGARLYWELTEQNIEEWAIKLRLKGEIPINSGKTNHSSHEPNQDRRRSQGGSVRSSVHAGMMSLFMPNRLRWNLGMDPNDMTLFGDLNFNSHLSISCEFGDTTQVGLYFKYEF